MSIRNLDLLFKPQSVALIGASSKERGIGATLLRNMLEGGYKGALWPVNPKYERLQGMPCYAKVAALPAAPDLAVICTPPASIPGLIRELGARGTKAAIVMTAGLEVLKANAGKSIEQAMLEAAKPHLLRILGTNSVGLLVPALGLNASFAHSGARPGKIAFVSQSGGLATGVLDWANARGIGFSKFVSLGGGADVDFGDLLDYLAGDADTGAILLYLQDLRGARKFMSAARVAARSKPVIVLRAGRDAGKPAGAGHAGALAGRDAVYDAAIRRAGMLRVHSSEELFNAVETLAYARTQRGERLAIVSNSAGLGLMAGDALLAAGGHLATLSAETARLLGRVLPQAWSQGNPVDILGDAPLERYLAALPPLLAEPQADALLFLHAPTAMLDSAALAAAVAPLAQAAGRNVLSCWLGGAEAAPARQVFSRAGLPCYATPERAVQAFMQIVQYRRNQDLLMQVPVQAPAAAAPQRARARAIVA
ncbi:acetate--CoA ligase family protein, partial [Janthinobacterium sp.]|uniref:acetate--CoA ligase family protein n=1 Tax=Janthinobacterium sp. TaxID=1871054 RepID=UPI00293D6382